MNTRTFIISGLLFATCSFPLTAVEDTALLFPNPKETPWFTGPLRAPSGTVIGQGRYSIQTYLSTDVVTGGYNSHWKTVSSPNLYYNSVLLQARYGVTDFMDIMISPQVYYYNYCQSQSSTGFGDLPLELDFQLIRPDRFEWFPGVKLGIIEIFPTGKYQKLNLKKKLTDLTGEGSFSTTPYLLFYKIYHLSGHHYLSTIACIQYTYAAPVHVKGHNYYRGGKRTRGKVYPGNEVLGILSFEYSFTRNWVFALDNIYEHNDKDRFRGKQGFTKHRTKAKVGYPSSESLSFAPAIEYNFNQKLGIITGVWFTAAGRNTLKFYNGLFSFVAQY